MEVKEVKIMKHLLIVTLANNEHTIKLIHDLSAKGYDATVYSTTSLRHALDDTNEDLPTILTLQHLHSNHFVNNTTIMFVAEENKINEVKQVIREETDHFKKIGGGMWTTPIEDYEGSFIKIS